MGGPPSCLMRCEQPCHWLCTWLSGAVLALVRLDTHVCVGTQPVTQSLDATVSSHMGMGKGLASGDKHNEWLRLAEYWGFRDHQPGMQEVHKHGVRFLRLLLALLTDARRLGFLCMGATGGS